jgi:hypothetical protein
MKLKSSVSTLPYRTAYTELFGILPDLVSFSVSARALYTGHVHVL